MNKEYEKMNKLKNKTAKIFLFYNLQKLKKYFANV